MGETMRTKITIALLAVALLGLAHAAVAAPNVLALLTTQGHAANFTPLPKMQLAACRFWQCNCHRECVIYDGSKCVQWMRTCDTCSKCDD
jgi:hypothetical protein